MRAMKVAVSALAVAFALAGPVYAAGTTAPAQGSANSTVQSTQPAKHRILRKRTAAKKAPAPAKASTTNNSNTTSTGAH